MSDDVQPDWKDQLAQICCDCLAAERSLTGDDEVEAEVQAIRDNLDPSVPVDQPLHVELEQRIRTLCQEPSIHRTEEVRAKAEEMERIWRRMNSIGSPKMRPPL